MDLLDDFDRVRATFSELSAIGQRIDSSYQSADESGGVGPSLNVASTSYDLPGLSVEATMRQAARGRGQIVAAACAADVVILATSRGYLLRYQWDEYGNEKVTETELTRAADSRIRGLFLDPSGTHSIACIRGSSASSSSSSSSCELAYIHASWTKPRLISKLKGLQVTAVGWQKQAGAGAAGGGDEQQGGGRPGSAGSSRSSSKQGAVAADSGGDDVLLYTTGDIILGSEGGALHTTNQDSRSKREGPSSLLLDFKDKAKAICSVDQEVLPGGRRVVLLVTPNALYITVGGGPGLQPVFAKYAAGVPWEPLLEVESPSMHSRLHLLRGGGDSSSLPTRFAWLVGNLLLHGHLLLQQLAGDSSVGDGAEYVGDMRQLQLGPSNSSPEDEPVALACSEYHYLLLYADRLVAINQVSGKVAAEVGWGPGSHVSGSIVGTPLGLMQDSSSSSGSMQVWSGEALHEAVMSNEGKDMWRTYLEYQDYDNALKLAADPGQRDVVYQAMGADAAAAGDWRAAGSHFGRIVSGKPPFEELALLLVESGEPEALQVFLQTKLQVLGPSDKAQSTMVAAWLTELLLDQINRDLLAGAGQHTADYLTHVEQLRSFLTQYAPVLNWNTTTSLLESYGRLEELEVFAGAKGDQEALLEYLMRNPVDGARRALGVLRKPSVGPQLVYKFAPELLAAATQETVDFLVTSGSVLDPRQLLPALVRFGEPDTPPAKREQVLQYVAYAMEQLGCTDRAVANLAVALLSLEESEARLLDFLARARSPLGKPLFDPKYALRLAKERNRRRACVKLLCELGLFEDAVFLALAVDLELAKAVANTPDEDDGLRRKLWLSIAKHVVQGGGEGGAGGGGAGAAAAGTAGAAGAAAGDDGPQQAERIKLAVEFLKEAGGLLKIEDILPFFPDFVTIDAFKGAITDSLTRYNRQIEELKAEMDEATEIAEAVRRNLKLLSNRTAVISSTELCVACGRAILDPPPNTLRLPSGGAIPPFYLFPTGQAFHALCAAAEVVQYGGELRAGRVKKLLQRLARTEPLAAAAAGVGGGSSSSKEDSVGVLAARLEEEVGGEDPWNGELLAGLIDLPFIQPDRDADEIMSWRI